MTSEFPTPGPHEQHTLLLRFFFGWRQPLQACVERACRDLSRTLRSDVLLRRTSGRGWRVFEREVGPCDYAWSYIFEQNPSYPAVLLREWANVSDPEPILGIRPRWAV